MSSKNRFFESPVSARRAKDIMENNFHDVAEAEAHFHFRCSEKCLSALNTIPLTEAELVAHRETHILVPGLPLSIVEMQTVVPLRTFRSFHFTWYNHEKFASQQRIRVRWHLIRKAPLPTAHVKDDDFVTFACELVYGIVLHQLASKEQIYVDMPARCRDRDSQQCEVTICNKVDGIFINAVNELPGRQQTPHGLATARRTLPVVRHKDRSPQLISFPKLIAA